ncbi:MAG: bifunctional DNA primase/polymerase [Actinomycetota bacterium]|nr:bifunctional DNA primase/polymerase [Actinomycetota bacterium]
MTHPVSLTVPDVSDLDTLSAALRYADAGWYVLPVNPRDKKNPGSRVGLRWPTKSSRDPEQLVAWFAGSSDLLAVHVGRSGAVVFDVDNPDAVPEVLRPVLDDTNVPFQSTRTDTARRGHYPFLMPPDRTLGNGKSALPGPWGEVRGRNGVVIVAPSEHEKATTGGRYAWLRTGRVPALPDTLAARLSDAQDAADTATDAEVAAFLDQHTERTRPELLNGKVTAWTRKLDAGESRHETACGFVTGAMKEARAGYYSAQEAAGVLGALFVDRATSDKPGDPTASTRSVQAAVREFDGIVSWAVAQANSADLDAVRRGSRSTSHTAGSPTSTRGCPLSRHRHRGRTRPSIRSASSWPRALR